MSCVHSIDCGFFSKFKDRQSLVWKAMIKKHCVAGEDCARRLMLDAGQPPPSDDLMPVGVHASRAFLMLP